MSLPTSAPASWMAREASWSAPGTGALDRTSRTLAGGSALGFTSRLARNPKRGCAPHSKTWRRTPSAGGCGKKFSGHWTKVAASSAAGSGFRATGEHTRGAGPQLRGDGLRSASDGMLVRGDGMQPGGRDVRARATGGHTGAAGLRTRGDGGLPAVPKRPSLTRMSRFTPKPRHFFPRQSVRPG